MKIEFPRLVPLCGIWRLSLLWQSFLLLSWRRSHWLVYRLWRLDCLESFRNSQLLCLVEVPRSEDAGENGHLKLSVHAIYYFLRSEFIWLVNCLEKPISHAGSNGRSPCISMRAKGSLLFTTLGWRVASSFRTSSPSTIHASINQRASGGKRHYLNSIYMGVYIVHSAPATPCLALYFQRYGLTVS